MNTIAIALPHYHINTFAWFLHDEPSEARIREIAFHVKSGDYFATLATIMMLVADSLQDNRLRNEPPSQFHINTVQALKDELMHVHRAYRITNKV